MEPARGSRSDFPSTKINQKTEKNELQKKTDTIAKTVSFNDSVKHSQLLLMPGLKVTIEETIPLIDEDIAPGLTKEALLKSKSQVIIDYHNSLFECPNIRESSIFKKNKVAKDKRKAERERRVQADEPVDSPPGYRRKEQNSARFLTKRDVTSINKQSPSWIDTDLDTRLKHLMKEAERAIKKSDGEITKLSDITQKMIAIRTRVSDGFEIEDIASLFLLSKYSAVEKGEEPHRDEQYIPAGIIQALKEVSKSRESAEIIILEKKTEILVNYIKEILPPISDPSIENLLISFRNGLTAKGLYNELKDGKINLVFRRETPQEIRNFMQKQEEQLLIITAALNAEKDKIKKPLLDALWKEAMNAFKEEGKEKFSWPYLIDTMFNLHKVRNSHRITRRDILGFVSALEKEKNEQINKIRSAGLQALSTQNINFSWTNLFNKMNEVSQTRDPKLNINYDLITSEDLKDYVVERAMDGALSRLFTAAETDVLENKKINEKATWAEIEAEMKESIQKTPITINVVDDYLITNGDIAKHISARAAEEN